MINHQVCVCPDGLLVFVYDDALRALLGLGPSKVARASHVEPTMIGEWEADLSPSGGPVLGPFELQLAAIQAEVDWLETHLG